MSRIISGKDRKYFIRILRGHAACGFPVTRDAVRRLTFRKDEWQSVFGTFAEYKLRALGVEEKTC